ncbi:MAG: hypothetical protein IJ689_03640 [Alphaproteobacteria bacterium]|nr:hypothetical protein [Alphaproteobacteria bacterium]
MHFRYILYLTHNNDCPCWQEDDSYWTYSDSGVINYTNQGAIVSASNATVGTFTANIPNPAACNTASTSCGWLQDNARYNLFGGTEDQNGCEFAIKYSGSGNSFKVIPYDCTIGEISSVTTGAHSDTITITYRAS